MKYRWLLIVLAVIAIAPTLVFAKHTAINESVWQPAKILAGPLTVCTGNYLGAGTSGTSQTNGLPPCQDLCDLTAQIVQILYFVMAVGIWIIIPITFAYGAIMLMISQGEPAKISEARKILIGTLIGVAIMLCAYLIVSAFVGFLGLQGIGSFGGAGLCS